jgi:hypothetical protein
MPCPPDRAEVRAWVAETRAAQGLPPHVEDDEVLMDLADAVTETTSRVDPDRRRSA